MVDFKRLQHDTEIYCDIGKAVMACHKAGARIGGMGQRDDGDVWFTTLHKGSHMVVQQGGSLVEAIEKALKALARLESGDLYLEGTEGQSVSKAVCDAAEKAMRGLTWEFDEWAYRSKTR